MIQCYVCGFELPRNTQIFRETECPQCNKPLKVCLNCTFYQRGLQWDCRETITEPVIEKDRANFCDYFRVLSSTHSVDSKAPPQQPSKFRTEFDKLFG